MWGSLVKRDPRPVEYEVENQSRWRIIVRETNDPADGCKDDLVLAPLERRIMNEHPAERFPVRLLLRHHALRVRPHLRRPLGGAHWEHTAFLLVLFLSAAATAAVFGGGWFRGTSWALICAVVAITLFTAATAGALRDWAARRSGLPRGPGDPQGYEDALLEPPGRSEAVQRLAQRTTFLVVAIIGLVGPAIAIYYGTDLRNHVSFAPDGFRLLRTNTSEVVGRGIQLVYLSIVSTLPALLYFQFDRQRLGALRAQWTRHLFYMNPNLYTVSEVEAAYGTQFDEALGSGSLTGRLIGGRRSPIIIATTLLTLGWTLILLETMVRGTAAMATPRTFLDLINPQPTVVTFAFLGAYFFALQVVIRAFVRGDLRPKNYSSISARIIVVVILAYLFQVTSVPTENPVAYMTAFTAGYLPDTLLRRLQSKFLGMWARSGWSDEERPLTMIGGIDVYERARLLDEGIANVGALAHHDFVDLMIKTRFQVPQLMDWVDQALLLVHLPNTHLATHHIREASTAAETGNAADPLVARLHDLAIRTATDFVRAVDEDPEVLEAVLALPGDGGDAGRARYRLANLDRAIQEEPFWWRLEAWRDGFRSGLGAREPAETVYLSDEGFRDEAGRVIDLRAGYRLAQAS